MNDSNVSVNAEPDESENDKTVVFFQNPVKMITENENKKKHAQGIVNMMSHDEAYNHDPMLKKVKMLQKEIEKEEKIREVPLEPKPIFNK